MMQTPTLSNRQRARASGLPRPARLGLALAEVLLIIALAYIGARMIWLVAFGASATDFQLDPALSGTRPGGARYVADLTRLRDTDPFADRRAEPVDAAPVAAAVQETQLNLVLRGIRRGATPQSGGAIVQTPDNRQRFFAVGATVLDGVTMEEVHVDHVLIRRRGVLESLYLREEDGAAARASGNAPAAQTRAPTGSQSIAGLFRADPVREGGALSGYRIADGNAAMLSAMGLRNGDVITAIDGRSAADIADLPALFRTLREQGVFTLSINRGGLPLEVQVDLPR